MTIASGTNVSLAYARERTRGTTPTGLGTSVDNVAAAATKFTRASGSWITDGFAVGQWVESEGFAGTGYNDKWRVTAVTATDLTVDDGGVLGTEAAASGQKVTIVLQTLRATARAINLTKGILESAEVRADRQKSDVRHGFNQVAGAPGFELSIGAYDDWLECLLGGAWTAVAVSGGPNFGSHSSGYFERSAGSFITDGFRAGDIIRTASFVNGANNADWRVSSVTADKLYVVVPSGVTMVTEAAGAGPTLVYPGKRLDVGSSLLSMVVERRFSDIAKYQLFKGVVVDQMSLSIQPEAIVGGTFNVIGMSADAVAGSSAGLKTPKASDENSPFAAFDGAVYEAAALISLVTGIDFTINNNRALQAVVGSKYSPDVFDGTLELTGTLTALFESETLLNKFINETESSVWTKLQDPNDTTHFMSIVLPRVKYNGGEIDPPQLGPVPISMPFRALVQTGLASASDTTTASTITIQRSNS